MVIAFYKGEGDGGVKVIKVEGGREKEKEVIVRHGIVPLQLKTWNYDDFSKEWNKNYFTKKKK